MAHTVKSTFLKSGDTNKHLQCLISFSVMCPIVMHMLSACQRRWGVNYFGDVVWIRRIIALKTSGSGPLHYMKSKTDGFLQPAQYVGVTSLTSDVITAKEMSEPSRKQSPQTAITSHFGGAENKRARNERKISNITAQRLADVRCNKTFILYRFQPIEPAEARGGVLPQETRSGYFRDYSYVICGYCCLGWWRFWYW